MSREVLEGMYSGRHAKSTNWVVCNGLHKETSVLHRKFSLRIYSRRNILLRLFVVVYNILLQRPGELMGHNIP